MLEQSPKSLCMSTGLSYVMLAEKSWERGYKI